MKEKIKKIITDALDEILEDLPRPVEDDFVLLGADGALDSFGFVTLTVGVEQGISETFGRKVILVSA